MRTVLRLILRYKYPLHPVPSDLLLAIINHHSQLQSSQIKKPDISSLSDFQPHNPFKMNPTSNVASEVPQTQDFSGRYPSPAARMERLSASLADPC
jgi:hypothetical protein